MDMTKCHKVSVLVFSYAGRSADKPQLCYLPGMLVDEMCEGSIFHLLSLSSHKSHRPVKSIGLAEILAAGEPIDEGKMIA